MTDPDRLPEHDEAVRRLLADARHEEPAPPEVVARLDTVLADLTADRQEPTPVVELRAARRRRRAASLLLAAAAVVAVGVGLNQVMTPSGMDSAGDAASEEAAEAPSGGTTLLDRGGDRRPAPRTAFPLSSDSLDADLRAARVARTGADASASRELACVVPPGGDQVAVTLDGDPGVAVFRSPRGGRQRVDVFLCGEVEPARTVRLPAP